LKSHQYHLLKLIFFVLIIKILTSIFVNLLKTNLNKADAIFCYLRPSLMKKLESKFKCELKRGARVIVHSFPLPNLEPKKVVKIQKHTLYLYQF
jgi:hypothetical protein